MCVQDITFEDIFLKTAAFTVRFSNIHIPVPNSAMTRWEHLLKRKFYSFQCGMHNQKFVFFRQSATFS